jgi:hypothetical protein
MRLARALTLVLAACAFAAPSAHAASDPCPGGALLPQLDPLPPHDMELGQRTIGGETHQVLAFTTFMSNVGRGPFEIVGTRARPGGTMHAKQVVACANGLRSAGPAGTMRYVRLRTHEHFHLMHLERYRLMALDGRELDRATKRGFCLGDTAESALPLANKASTRVFSHDPATACGAHNPAARRVVLGLSVGWGDLYLPFVEGQYVDLDGVPAGVYRVLGEVDPARRLLESDSSDNVAGVDIRLSWPDGPDGVPAYEELGTCETRAACASTEPAVTSAKHSGLTAYASAMEALADA